MRTTSRASSVSRARPFASASAALPVTWTEPQFDVRPGSHYDPPPIQPVSKDSRQLRERGSGLPFREKYRDKKTGQLKVCRTWTMKLWVGGKALKAALRDHLPGRGKQEA